MSSSLDCQFLLTSPFGIGLKKLNIFFTGFERCLQEPKTQRRVPIMTENYLGTIRDELIAFSVVYRHNLEITVLVGWALTTNN